MPEPEPAAAGIVYLVGGGPGDPGLITLRGVECLRRADVVLYDYLVNPRLLEHARPGAELVCLGRHGRDRIVPQDEINERLCEEALKGKTVVRLKGGDPMIFARAADELAALAAAGVAYEIVPGITAAQAAACYAGIPMTDRETASAVAIVTGQQGDEADVVEAAGLDYPALARFPGTLFFYMGVTTAREWTAALIEAGKPAATPAAIVRRASWPDQATFRCTLGSVAAELAAVRMRPPVVVVVGDVAAKGDAESWFVRRPLFGMRIVVTRPLKQSQPLRDRLEELGAAVLVQPAIQIGPPADWGPVDRAIERLESFDWIVFSSANGVRGLLDRIQERGHDLRKLGKARLAAIGPGTADELAGYRLKADVQPAEFRAESLAAALAPDAAGKRFLLARASRGREVLAESLVAAGAEVEQVVVYSSRDIERPDPENAQAIAEGRIDWITVTSSAIAESLVKMFGDSLRKTRLASISPITSETLRRHGHEPACEAGAYTMAGLIEAIVATSRG